MDQSTADGDERLRLAGDVIDNGWSIEPVPMQGRGHSQDGNLNAMRRSREADDVQLGYSSTLDQVFIPGLPVGLDLALSRYFHVLKPLLVIPGNAQRQML